MSLPFSLNSPIDMPSPEGFTVARQVLEERLPVESNLFRDAQRTRESTLEQSQGDS
jgi:hypothetical protein